MSKKQLSILLICLLCITAVCSVALFVGCEKNVAVNIIVNDIVETYNGNPVSISCNTDDGAYQYNL